MNSGSPIFFRASRSSALNVNMVSDSLLPAASWLVHVESLGSDHIHTYAMHSGLSDGRCFKRKVTKTNCDDLPMTGDASADINMHVDLLSALTSASAACTKVFAVPEKYSTDDVAYEHL